MTTDELRAVIAQQAIQLYKLQKQLDFSESKNGLWIADVVECREKINELEETICRLQESENAEQEATTEAENA